MRSNTRVSLKVRLTAVVTIGLAALSGAAIAEQKAGTPTPAQLMEALRTKTTRAANAPLSKDEIERRALIDRLKAKATRGLSLPEREQLASAVSSQPKVDLEIYFDFDSDKITPTAEPTLRSLGEALRDASADFLVAGHTDAKGKPGYNLDLSQRRAAAIRDYLATNFGVAADRLLAVGYGREKLKNPGQPLAPENRRVQIVNMADKATAEQK